MWSTAPYWFADWLLNLILTFWEVYRLKPWFQKSLIYRVLNFLAGHVAELGALFVLASLIIPYSYWNNRYSTLAAVILLGLFLIKTMGDRSVRFAVKAIDLFMFLFMLCILLAHVFSAYPQLSLRFLVFYGTDFLIMLILVSSIRTKEQFSTVLEIIMVGVALAGLYGFYQGIVGVPVIQSQVDLDLNEGMPGRVFSVFGNSNIFAQIIVMFVPFFAAIILSARMAEEGAFPGGGVAVIGRSSYDLFQIGICGSCSYSPGLRVPCKKEPHPPVCCPGYTGCTLPSRHRYKEDLHNNKPGGHIHHVQV